MSAVQTLPIQSSSMDDASGTAWSRLLHGATATRPMADLAVHLQTHGSLPASLRGAELIALVEAAGLTGRGGAGFPSHRKLTAVAAGVDPVVVGNGAEGEPASRKDRVLLDQVPHLVLDGLQLVARAVGARTAFVYVHEGPLVERVRAAIASRAAARVDAIHVDVVTAPDHFLSGQESAAVSRISGRAALPRAVPPAVYERGVNRRPTLVQNVETLAHIALIARYGADWFRTAGTSQDPGTMLFTVSGAVRHPGVIEAPVGVTARQLLAQAGWTAPLQALLVGGYHGSWLGVPAGLDLPLSAGALKPLGLSPGAGVVVAFPADSCGLVETSRVANYMADVSAGQCGPCLNGLPALAETFAALAALQRSPRLTTRIEELCGLVQGRGACHHPDGTTRFVRSALVVFEAEVRAHLAGRCTATSRQPVLPTPYERS